MTSEFVVDNAENVLAIILWRESGGRQGVRFVTPKHFPLQLGVMHHPKDYVIPRHKHRYWTRKTVTTMEVLFVREGIIEVDLWATDGQRVCSKVLVEGDIILLAEGSHAITFRDDAKVVEVKQGPYVSEDVDKERL